MNTPENRFINHTLWFITTILIWTVIIVSSLTWNRYRENRQSIELASKEAQAYSDKNKAIRLWSASHGGVYVPVNEQTQPHPHLSQIPERDITTPSGKKLTLMNPTYMLDQMMRHYGGLHDVKEKMTTFPDKLINPENMPDQWELDALHSLKKGSPEVKAVSELNGLPHFRLMRPLFIKKECLKCHAFQGYKVGDLRGGVAIAVSMDPYLKIEQETLNGLYITHGLFWAFGLIVFGHIFSQAGAQQQERKQAEETLLQLNRELEMLSFMDGLTSIANRRSFDRALDREWDRSRRDQKPLSLVMIDIDCFKDYNDHCGHQCGDECLKLIAQTLKGVLKRAGDMVARYGGEEFVLLLPGTELEQATLLAEECRNKILEQSIDFQTSKVINVVSISLGVCTTIPANDREALALLEAADRALYRAKENGRNRVESSKL